MLLGFAAIPIFCGLTVSEHDGSSASSDGSEELLSDGLSPAEEKLVIYDKLVATMQPPAQEHLHLLFRFVVVLNSFSKHFQFCPKPADIRDDLLSSDA